MISYEISGKTASSVDVVLHLPSDRLPQLLTMIEKVDRVSTLADDQQKRIDALLEAGRQRLAVMKRDVIKQYVRLVDEGRCPIESVSLTLKVLKARYPNLYFDGVKHFLADSGVLRNVGYYNALKERKTKEV